MQSAGPNELDESTAKPDEPGHARQAEEVIDILTWAARYRWSRNANVADKGILWVFKWLLPIELASAVIIAAMREVEDHYLTHRPGWLWSWMFSAIACAGMAAGVVVVVRALWILWRRRAYLAQDQGIHIQKAYLLHDEQARLLASYPVTVLAAVNRFYEKRPFVVQGLYSTVFGGNTLTLASVGALFSLIKGFFDMHALGPVDSGVRFDLWIGLFFFLTVAVVARLVRVREDHQRGLLAEAIVLASEPGEAGPGDAGPAVFVD